MIRIRWQNLSVLGLAASFLAGGCDLPGSAGEGGGTPAARSGPHVLTVEEAAGLIAEREGLPNNEDVARAVANVWLDYTLLGRAAARDSTYGSLDLTSVVRPQLEQVLVSQLRDSVVQVDTIIGEEELRSLWSESAPGTRVRARHILLAYPDGATTAQRDSVQALARELRSRAVAGESFAELAREHSDDTGSAQRGGDLGEFGRDEMVPAFEEAAFALEAGQISEPVETPFGLHVIKVEERTQPEFEGSRESFRTQLRQQRRFRAESTYVAGVMEDAEISLSGDAARVVRELAARPGVSLSGRAARRPLAEYRNGELTARSVLEFLRGQSFRVRAQVEQAGDEQVESLLRDLVRRELLLAQAREAGLEIPEARRDSLVSQARASLVQAADGLGLRRIESRADESGTETIDRAVRETLRQTLSNQAQAVSLGPLSFSLRRQMGGQIYEPALARVVERVAALRDAGEGSGADTAGPGPVPGAPATADTAR